MKSKPNIILINCDDLGYGDIGCYGSTLNRTPAIDSLARDGIRLTDFYASAPVCTPSRGGMLTGCYPKRIDFQSFGVYDYREPNVKQGDFGVLMPGQPEGLNPEETTIAQVLKQGGYTTKIIGKWHVGDQPEYSPMNFGFDSWFGLPYSNDMGLRNSNTERLKKREYTLCPLPLIEDGEVIQEQPDQTSLTERYTQEAVNYIRKNRNKPFFLYFAHMYVHHPLFVPERFMKTSRNGVFGAAVAEIDWSVQVLLYELKQLGLTENTLLIFTSDNGGDERSVNKPLRGFKGSTWEGGMRVNCIMKLPSLIAKGQICSEVTSMMDFYPTFAELAGVKLEDDVKRDGYSLMPILGGDLEWKSPYDAFFYYCCNELQAVRRDRYKLHLKSGELYDLQEDIEESNNIAHLYPEVVGTLNDWAKKGREDMGDSLTKTSGQNVRPKGFVKDFKPITQYQAEHPYMMASYDLSDD